MRKPRRRRPRDLVTTHRDLVDAEFALNGDGGGGVLSEDTGKPLLFYVQGAEKSSAEFLVTTHNAGGHSSMPRADNAIYELADALKARAAHRISGACGTTGRWAISRRRAR